MKNIIIYGPTAVGKTAISVMLAKKLNAEIISCDSMQIYTDLNIGSAKVTQEEMQGIPHYQINIRQSNQNYSVFEYVNDCKKCIEEIKSRGKNVIIVGGTGLYIKALTENYNYANANVDKTLRNQLENLDTTELCEIIKENGIQIKQDDKNNKPRLIRQIEIIKSGNIPTKNIDDNYIIFGLISNREALYNRINARVDKMLDMGLVEETKSIYTKYGEDNQCFKAIGYKELLPFLKNEATLSECVDKIKQHSRNYAKRQITFMNQFPSIIRIEVENIQTAYDQILGKIEEKND